MALGSIPGCFPEVPGQEVSGLEYAEALIARIVELEDKAPCGCPKRSAPPEAVSLPCPATEENAGRLKEFLINSYKQSPHCVQNFWKIQKFWTTAENVQKSSRNSGHSGRVLE